jgi:hypothetical protein
MAEKKKKTLSSFFGLKRGTSQEKNLTPESLSPKGTRLGVRPSDRLNATRPALKTAAFLTRLFRVRR